MNSALTAFSLRALVGIILGFSTTYLLQLVLDAPIVPPVYLALFLTIVFGYYVRLR